MNRKRYHHEQGVVVGGSPERPYIELESGNEVWADRGPVGETFYKKDKVVVAWKSQGPYPKPERSIAHVECQAVELVTKWHRRSTYERLFDTVRLSFEVESEALCALRKVGVRAEKATDFEDERLGVDFWVLLNYTGAWIWYPVDVTLRSDLQRFVHTSKYSQVFEKRVLLVRFGNGHEVTPEEIMNQMHEQILFYKRAHRQVLTRPEAVLQEVKLAGNKPQLSEIKTYRLIPQMRKL